MVIYETKYDTSKLQFENEDTCSGFVDNIIPFSGAIVTLVVSIVIALMM